MQFLQMIRTTNDLEGNHRAWNAKGKGNVQFYRLVDLLHTLASDFERTKILLSGGNKLRAQKNATTLKNEKLKKFWNEVERRKMAKEPQDLDVMINTILTIQRPSPRIGPNACAHTFFDPTTIPQDSDSE